ncbi:putative pentatricopeptide repeat-containing protein [Heracleum sosnowskyi]|uniref:Pentatricopeptide repeat-containing protein n=1 Tax=Heracleum sosnowskyi TaxID=360622 RepID=A0AAD8J0C0_9APIA|nr:putative pentatricopeptide repeat-containing protein [Heracleum sosnowskyi]
MRSFGVSPDHNMFPSVLKSCAFLKDLRVGECVHGCIVRFGMEFDVFTGNALMNMYSKLGGYHVFDERSERGGISRNGGGLGFVIDGVRKVFEMMPVRDIVSWNTVIAGYARNGMCDEGLRMIRDMGNAGLKPDVFTLSSVLPVFAEYVDVLRGKEIHGYVIRHGFCEDVFIGSSLIDMYANCTRTRDAYRVFCLLPYRDYVSWNSVIAGCVQNGLFDEGLNLFRQMVIAGIKPVEVSFSSIIPACAHLTTLLLGRQLHGYIVRGGFDKNVFIASSLVDMYAKCGNIRISRWIFDDIEKPDMVTWTAMIMGYALHGHPRDAISSFERMILDGVKPNDVVFLAVFTACSHGGMVDEALKYFNSMTQYYGISPCLEHYAAMSDLLARAGKLEEAYRFISNMQIKQTGSIWSTLLAACRSSNNIELAEKISKKIVALDPENLCVYVLLSSTYSASERWGDAANLHSKMRNKGLKKKAASSWIEVGKEVHAFVAGDNSHPSYNEISDAHDVLLTQMELEGYVPDTS